MSPHWPTQRSSGRSKRWFGGDSRANELKLHNGSRIAIIGGGPAGAFFAHFALKLAKQKGLQIAVTIFDGKNFVRQGPPGCNMCAGVVSETLLARLEEEGIRLPYERVQRRIDGYYLQARDFGLLLTHPQGKKGAISTVYRGSGPRSWPSATDISFDDFLLGHAKKDGVEVVEQVVRDVILPVDPNERVRLLCGDPESQSEYEADLLVGAFGLNTAILKKIAALGFGYRPPDFVRAFQAELEVDADHIREHLGNNIYALSLGLKHIRFAGLTPKSEHVTVSIIGFGDATRSDLMAFLNLPAVQRLFPIGYTPSDRFCCCRPRIALTPAKRPYADRFVIVGDASCCRYYKNGIESAFVTAKLAAEAAFCSGVSASSFRRVYWRKARRTIVRDNLYGRLLYEIHDIASRYRLMTQSYYLVASSDRAGDSTARLARQILWDMFTGNVPYRKIFFRGLDPRLQVRLVVKTLGLALKSTRSLVLDRDRGQKNSTYGAKRSQKSGIGLGVLQDGQTVAIIGGGPGGAACAIALKNLAAETGKDIDVILYEGKRFSGEAHYNQCVGVLSPPIERILTDELGIPFPHHLVLGKINAYVLHSDRQAIELSGTDEPSRVLRRVQFDAYLLEQARARGVRVIHSRVTDIELRWDSVGVYSESEQCQADVLVGAFGLDDGGCRLFERATARQRWNRYSQPRALSSIVTKIYPRSDFLDRFGERIHAFLPSIRQIEFGAITPKRDHLTVNIAGADIDSPLMDRFLELPAVQQVLPAGQDLLSPYSDLSTNTFQYFKGRFPVSVAHNYCGDRYVVVGDAAGLVRSFKGKGVNSACINGIVAAKAMMIEGISKEAFQAYLASDPRLQAIMDDLFYGRVIRRLAILSASYGFLDGVIDLAGKEPLLRRALFNCVSANKPYREIVWETWQPVLALRLAGTVGSSLVGLHSKASPGKVS